MIFYFLTIIISDLISQRIGKLNHLLNQTLKSEHNDEMLSQQKQFDRKLESIKQQFDQKFEKDKGEVQSQHRMKKMLELSKRNKV